MEEVTLSVPLGYSHIDSANQKTDYDNLKKVIGKFSRVNFYIEHLDTDTYRIAMEIEGAEARQGLIDIKNVVTGIKNDCLRLQYGYILHIWGADGSNLKIKISSSKK